MTSEDKQQSVLIRARIQTVLYSSLVLIWMVIIFAFSSQPDSNEVTKSIFGIFNIIVRKFAHMTEFGLLFLLCFKAIRATQMVRYSSHQSAKPVGIFLFRFSKKYLSASGHWRAIILAAIFSIIYAASDECHQSFVPGRSAALSDVLVDTVGILIAFLFLKHQERRNSGSKV
ncbi:MAG: VanZ family protein [Candidatus Obscuribacterales bacterium]|nr:VanZ family protein [Candidatus Obscuribacterales bacterium]